MRKQLAVIASIFSSFCLLRGNVLAQDSAAFVFLAANKMQLVASEKDPFHFTDDVYKSRYIFFGENHGSSKPQETDYQLFTQLYRRAGIRHYVAEVDFTKAWLLNQFLRTGDTVLLDKVFASWIRDTAQWANREHYIKFQKLHAFQHGLGIRQQINIVGIDVPQDYGLVSDHISFLLADQEFGRFQPLVDSLKELAANQSKPALVSFAKRFFPVLIENRAEFERLSGDKYSSLAHLIATLTHLNSGWNRDKVMFLNFSAFVEQWQLQTTKMYGFLGFHHCLQTSYNQSSPFAALLKERLGNGTGMTTLAMLAIDSETMLPYGGMVRQMMPDRVIEKMLNEHPGFPRSRRYIPYVLSNDHPLMKVEGIGLLKSLTDPNSTSVFKLSGDRSPFRRSKLLGEVKGFQNLTMTSPTAATADAFQYVLLFRNSAAARPLK